MSKHDSITIFGSTLVQTRDRRVVWLLEEADVSYEHVRLDLAAGDHRQPDFLAIHPSGRIPAMVDGNLTLLESGAILLTLADRFGFAPAADDPERPLFYQWLFYGVSTLDFPATYMMTTAEGSPLFPDPHMYAHHARQFERVVPLLEQAVTDREFVLPSGFSAADIAIGYDLHLVQLVGVLGGHPVLMRYYERLASRPGFRVAFELS